MISAATHKAPYVLDGLTSHGTDLRIVKHYTDTGGPTDHIFALCAMLGLRFCPRLRDFPDRRLAPIAPVTAYLSITRRRASASAPTSSVSNGMMCCAS